MKKFLLYATSAVLGLFSALWQQPVQAAINAKITFDTEIPKAFVCDNDSLIELSGKQFKARLQPLCWTWNAPSTLQYNDFGQLIRSFRVKQAGVMLWIYNPRAVDADLHFAFETPTGGIPYHFALHLDFPRPPPRPTPPPVSRLQSAGSRTTRPGR